MYHKVSPVLGGSVKRSRYRRVADLNRVGSGSNQSGYPPPGTRVTIFWAESLPWQRKPHQPVIQRRQRRLK